MPSHQERREPLPKGYQFGDAGNTFKFGGMYLDEAVAALADSAVTRIYKSLAFEERPPVFYEHVGGELTSHPVAGVTANVIEGEQH